MLPKEKCVGHSLTHLVVGNMIRVLLAQFSLETHSRGIITVAHYLRDSGMEVILMGNGTPKQIINTAIAESADIVGISTYCGGELVLSEQLIREAEQYGVKEDFGFIIGGVFPQSDIPKLSKLGFGGVFLSATKSEIVCCVKKMLKGEVKNGLKGTVKLLR